MQAAATILILGRGGHGKAGGACLSLTLLLTSERLGASPVWDRAHIDVSAVRDTILLLLCSMPSALLRIFKASEFRTLGLRV